MSHVPSVRVRLFVHLFVHWWLNYINNENIRRTYYDT